MKVKFLFILLSVLLVVPTEAAVAKTEKRRKSNLQYQTYNRETKTRTPSEFNLVIQDENDNLKILFQSPLLDAEIIVTDKDGNTVVYEPQTFIYENKILYIYTPDAYPYTIEITSPIMDITGEIVQE